ncbi:hypothetical protein YC2023_019241 [Brassica napus]
MDNNSSLMSFTSAYVALTAAPAPSSGSKYGDVQTIQIVIVAELSAMPTPFMITSSIKKININLLADHLFASLTNYHDLTTKYLSARNAEIHYVKDN